MDAEITQRALVEVLTKKIEHVDTAALMESVLRTPHILHHAKFFFHQSSSVWACHGKGILGLGKTPEEAAKAYDLAWKEERGFYSFIPSMGTQEFDHLMNGPTTSNKG